MIISIIELKPLPAKENTILEILRFLQERVQLKRGCIECGLYQGCCENQTMLYLEFWQGEEELHGHLESHLYQHLLNAMEFCREKPEIFFYDVTRIKGMELIKSLRLKVEREDVRRDH